MKKIFKFTLAILIACLIFQLTITAFLEEDRKSTVDSDFENIYNMVTMLINEIKNDKKSYGLEEVDFNNIYLGDYIPIYESGQQLSKRCYPIIEDGEWKATVIAFKHNGTWVGQISRRYVDSLPYISSQDKLAIILGEEKEYLKKNSVFVEISDFNSEISVEEPLLTLQDSRYAYGIKQSDLKSVRKINTVNAVPYSNGSGFLDVPLVTKQIMGVAPKYNGACWAATCRAIGLYHGTDKTFNQIYNNAGIVQYGYGTTSASLGVFQNLYNYEAYQIMNANLSHVSYEIDGLRPVYAQMGYTTPGYERAGHAVVIRGYVEYYNSPMYSGSYSYIENENNPATIINQTIPKDSPFPYTGTYVNEQGDTVSIEGELSSIISVTDNND